MDIVSKGKKTNKRVRPSIESVRLWLEKTAFLTNGWLIMCSFVFW